MTTENETREPFDLERALSGDAVETRNFCKVSQLTFFNALDERPLVGVLHDQGIVRNYLTSWTKEGKISKSNGLSVDDLFMSPKPKVIRYLWVNPISGIPAPKMLTEEEASERIGTHGFIKIPGTATEFPA